MKKLLLFLALVPMLSVAKKPQPQKTDREVWVDIMYQMAEPVMKNMAEGKLQQVMDTAKGNKNLELSPTWDHRDKKVAYMEAFGRLLAGLAPWLNLPDDDTPLREWTRKAIINAVDPKSPDRLGWENGGQTLVDGAYVVEGLFRGYDSLWVPLPKATKDLYIKEIKGLRRYDPPYTNWLLFVGMEECFLKLVGADYDPYRVKLSLSKVEEWYIGDGLYSDGPSFAFDYYNSYVIQPMYCECLEMIEKSGGSGGYLIFDKNVVALRTALMRFVSVCRNGVSSLSVSSLQRAHSLLSAEASLTAWQPSSLSLCLHGRNASRRNSPKDRYALPSQPLPTVCSTVR